MIYSIVLKLICLLRVSKHTEYSGLLSNKKIDLTLLISSLLTVFNANIYIFWKGKNKRECFCKGEL